MPESDQGVSVSPSGDDCGHPFSPENRVKSARASFPRVEAPRPLGKCEEMFSRPVTGATKSPATPHRAWEPGRLSETVRKNSRLDRVSGAELA